ncbi:hypothetical protein J2S74_000837 [Evansella vedderi]|uniref:Uncharacterized protein n=1 Tax=Evansella vedderi TaxID=38282 RepID=A0ABT9ZTH6_9BACI|nr:hypothetical protein [Evansella vedderi]MDQ0253465.1 hypothetical protein [Evansella vedderi]
MKKLAYIAGVLFILISIFAQMTSLIDDRYTIGSIWFIGVFAGFLGLIGASKVGENYEKAKAILLFSVIFGFIGIGFYAIIPALLILYVLFQIRPKDR